jgi:flavin reductase (DIM6/NTAB) family NADH-FMN oxidoreductase RutF
VTASTDLRTAHASESIPPHHPAAGQPSGAPSAAGSAAGGEEPGAGPHSGSAHSTATAPDALDPVVFRSAFRRHAAGVAVITAAGPEGPAGFTATSLTSVAAEPPLLSFGISLGASSWPAVAEAEYVGVHILGDHQEELAAVFARSGADRFGPPTAWTAGPYGVPLLDGVPAWLIGRVLSRVPAGDHRIVVARAVAADPHGPGSPLLYHEGGFHRLPR